MPTHKKNFSLTCQPETCNFLQAAQYFVQHRLTAKPRIRAGLCLYRNVFVNFYPDDNNNKKIFILSSEQFRIIQKIQKCWYVKKNVCVNIVLRCKSNWKILSRFGQSNEENFNPNKENLVNFAGHYEFCRILRQFVGFYDTPRTKIYISQKKSINKSQRTERFQVYINETIKILFAKYFGMLFFFSRICVTQKKP